MILGYCVYVVLCAGNKKQDIHGRGVGPSTVAN